MARDSAQVERARLEVGDSLMIAYAIHWSTRDEVSFGQGGPRLLRVGVFGGVDLNVPGNSTGPDDRLRISETTKPSKSVPK